MGKPLATIVAVLIASTVAVGIAGPAYATGPTIDSVVLGGTPASPSFTVTGSGFGAPPTADALGHPCGSTTGYDYGPNALSLRDKKAVFGPQRKWEAGVSKLSGYDCIGDVIQTWTDSTVVFSLGSAYDDVDYQLTEGDPLKIGVKGTKLTFTAHYSGGPPQAPTEAWCNPNPASYQAQCASAYIHWNGSLKSIHQPVTVNHLGSGTYIATLWNGGYTGIQNDGNSVSGVVGPTAVFSLGGDGVEIGTVHGSPDPNCEMGFDAGSGASCRIPLPHPIDDGGTYKFLVSRAKSGLTTGKVLLPTGEKITIGKLMPAPASPTDFGFLTNFVEDFGPNVASIDLVPHSSVEFGKLTVPTGTSRLVFACAYATNNGAGRPILDFGGASCV